MVMATRGKRWTLQELHRLPDDGNRYELVHGELFVTPAPSYRHEAILIRLTRFLDPFVLAHGLGFVYHPRALVRFRDSEVEPDLFVGPEHPDPDAPWEKAPLPTLVVEIVSRSTRRRDYGPKKDLYLEIGVPEYWIVDRERRAVVVVRPGEPDRAETERFSWTPPRIGASLVVEIAAVLGSPPAREGTSR